MAALTHFPNADMRPLLLLLLLLLLLVAVWQFDAIVYGAHQMAGGHSQHTQGLPADEDIGNRSVAAQLRGRSELQHRDTTALRGARM